MLKTSGEVVSAGNEIGELLLDIGLISPQELAKAQDEQSTTGERLTLVLERLGLVSYHQLKDALELQFGVNFFSFAKAPPPKEISDVLKLATKLKHRVVPVASVGTQYTIAMVNPDDLIALDSVRVELKSGHLKKVVCTADEFEFFMRDTYQVNSDGSPVKAPEPVKPAPTPRQTGTKLPAKNHLQSLFADDDDDEDDDDDDDDFPATPTVKKAVLPKPAEVAPAAASAPLIEQLAAPVAEAVTEPVAETIVEPVAEAAVEPLVETAVEPVAAPPAFSLADLVSNAAAGLLAEPVEEQASAATAAVTAPLETVKETSTHVEAAPAEKAASVAEPTASVTSEPAVAAKPSPSLAPIPVPAAEHMPVSRKPAASVTSNSLPAMHRDILLGPVSPAVPGKSLSDDTGNHKNDKIPSNGSSPSVVSAKSLPSPIFPSSITLPIEDVATSTSEHLPIELSIEDVVAGVASDLVESIETNKAMSNSASRQLLEEVVESELGGMEETDINKLKEQQNSSIMLLAHEIIGKATQKRCSDIHLEPDANGVTLRYFLHGELLADCVLPGEIHQALVSSYKIIVGLDPDELEKPQDKKITTRVEDDQIELRVTTLPSDHGEMVAISMRFIEV